MTDDLISFTDLGTRVGKLVEEKDAAYGSSVDCAGDFLKLLFPNSIQPEQYGNALLLVRIFDKMKRIATNKDAFGESPYQDIAGYGLIGLRKDEKEKWMSPSPNAMEIDPDENQKEPSVEVKPVTMGEAMSMKNENPAFPPILAPRPDLEGGVEMDVGMGITYIPGTITHHPVCVCSFCEDKKESLVGGRDISQYLGARAGILLPMQEGLVLTFNGKEVSSGSYSYCTERIGCQCTGCSPHL